MFNSNKIIERIKRFKRDVSPRAFLVIAIALVVLLSGGVVVAASSAGTTQTQRTSAASGDNSSSNSSKNSNGVTQSSGTPTSGTSAPSNSSSESTVKSSGGSNKSSGGSGSTSGGSNSGSGGTTPPVTAPPTTTPPSNYIVADDGGFFAAYNSYCAANGCIQATAWRMSGATNGVNTGQCALTGSPSGSCGGANGSVAYSEMAGAYLFSYLSQRGRLQFTSTPGAVVTLYAGWAMRYDLHGYLGYGAACVNYGTGQNCS